MSKFTVLCLTLVVFARLHGQGPEFTPELWSHIEQRWLESQPVTIAYTRSGEMVSGQQIHASNDSLFIFLDKGLPVGPDWQKGLISIHVNDIESVLFQSGGNKLGRKKQATSLVFPSPNAQYSQPHVQLRSSSVYVDSLYNPPLLEDAFDDSKILRRAYRKKRIRYSFGVNFGSDVVMKEIEEVIRDSPLPYSIDSYGGNMNVEALDFSFRFFDRLIIGGSIFSRTSYTDVWGYSYNSERDVNYSYRVDYRENRIYAEYAILNTDRYFSRRFEVIAGAGVLLANPEWSFDYSYYYNFEDAENIQGGYNYYYYSDKLLGLQLKGAFHYYFFPGLSLWTALDVNLNQPFVVPEQELPTYGSQDHYTLPEHELGFSCVRFKLGLSLYF